MKKVQLPRILSILILVMSLTFVFSCNKDDEGDEMSKNIKNQPLTDSDKDALLFMLEEEKLARDTYLYLNDVWSIDQFANIQNSEQSHMDAIENLLIKYNIEYSILAVGEFYNQDLQNLYNQFVSDAAESSAIALQIGATIEDLDIVDLQGYINRTSNRALISVFEKLQCGSRNHLRSFVSIIENNGNTYTPQYLTQEEYEAIIMESQEQCN